MPRWSNDDRNALGILRYNAGLSREVVATALNLSLSTFIRYEIGETDIPMGIAESMAVLYHVPFDAIRDAIKSVKEDRGINSMGVYPPLMQVRAKKAKEKSMHTKEAEPV